jgi:hypothetical protein
MYTNTIYQERWAGRRPVSSPRCIASNLFLWYNGMGNHQHGPLVRQKKNAAGGMKAENENGLFALFDLTVVK